jgi:hypothetical protein
LSIKLFNRAFLAGGTMWVLKTCHEVAHMAH